MSDKCAEYDHKTQTFKPANDFKKDVVFYMGEEGAIKRKLFGMHGIVYENLDVKEESVEKNMLNFLSIGTQTETKEFTDQKDGIDLSPLQKFSSGASRSEIATAYQEYQKRKENNKLSDVIAISKGRRNITLKDDYSLRLCERMLDQNMTLANTDFLYYDSPMDEYQQNLGSLLPLWSLSNLNAKKMLVTSLSWNSRYPDLLAVGFCDVNEDGVEEERGLVCVYSLKGPSFPERIIECASGVSCVRFHPTLHYLLAVAMNRGDLALYNLASRHSDAVKDSKFGRHFHEDSLNEVQWLQDELPQKLCSISTDGTIIKWLVYMDSLIPDEVLASLTIEDWPMKEPPKGLERNMEPPHPITDAIPPLNSIGVSLSVNPQNALFLSGTMSGLIQEHSFEDSECCSVFDEHCSCVRGVHWNPFHTDVFLSCSDDFTAQVWEHTHKQSLFEFFFASQVKDASWAPFSSSLFAAVSGNAQVSVFDLALDKEKAIGTYAVYTLKQNRKLTKVQFHPTMPILVAGDEKGFTIVLKLSPNLRSSLKALNTSEEFASKEKEKMNKLLKFSISPDL